LFCAPLSPISERYWIRRGKLNGREVENRHPTFTESEHIYIQYMNNFYEIRQSAVNELLLTEMGGGGV
jgi:hypothetical protein